MQDYLVHYVSKLFEGYRIVQAYSAAEAADQLECLGYFVDSVQLAIYED